MRDEQTFGYCPDCGRAMPEPTDDGRCEARESCEERAAHFDAERLIDSAKADAARLWNRSLRG